MPTNPKNSGFMDVDQSGDPQYFVNCLKEQYAKNPKLRSNKQRTLEITDIQPGHFLLDAGCGTGIDALQMAALVGQTGQVFGVDLSQEMVASAKENAATLDLPVNFQQGDIYHLEFEENFFDRCRSDKTFQHLDEPEVALKELARVTKPGGKIVIADPDHDSLIIDTPFSDINHRFARFRSGRITQGGIAHQMYGMFKDLGLVDVHVEPLTWVYTDYEEKKITSPYLEEIWFAHELGAVTQEEAEKWSAYLQKAIEGGRFLCMQTYVITSCTIPG